MIASLQDYPSQNQTLPSNGNKEKRPAVYLNLLTLWLKTSPVHLLVVLQLQQEKQNLSLAPRSLANVIHKLWILIGLHSWRPAQGMTIY